MKRRSKANRCRLTLEPLESRCCPVTVTGLTTIPIPGVMAGDTVTIHATLNTGDPGESGEGEPLIINTSAETFTVSAYATPSTFTFKAKADGESISAYIVGSDGDDSADVTVTLNPSITVTAVSTMDANELTVKYKVANEDLPSDGVTSFDIGLFRSDQATYSASDTNNLMVASYTAMGGDLTKGDHTITVDSSHGMWNLASSSLVAPLAPDPALPYVLAVADPMMALPSDIKTDSSQGYFRIYTIAAVTHGQQFSNKPSAAAWVGQVASGLSAQGYDRVIPFYWTTWLPAPGQAQAAGMTLAAQVQSQAASFSGLQPNDIIDVQLIGHSRGSSVIGVAMNALVGNGIPHLQNGFYELTFLDPHPANAGTVGAVSTASLTLLSLGWTPAEYIEAVLDIGYFVASVRANDPTITVAPRVNEAQDFYQTNSNFGLSLASLKNSPWEAAFNLWGVPSQITIADTSKTLSTSLGYPVNISSLGVGHGEVPLWYLANLGSLTNGGPPPAPVPPWPGGAPPGGGGPDQLLVIPKALDVGSGTPGGAYVLAVTPAGNLDATFTGAVTLAVQNPAGVLLGGSLMANAANGVAEFTNVTIDTPGNGYVLQASSMGATAGSSPAIKVTGDQLAITTGVPNIAAVGSSYPIVVEALNGTGAVDSTFNGPVTVTVGNPFDNSQVDTVTLTAMAGVASGTLTLTAPGQFLLTAASSGAAEAASPIQVTPGSSVAPLPAVSSLTFAVHWSGSDGTGPGIAAYDIYVSDNGGPWQLWQSQTSQLSAYFTGQPGHTYGFYSVATDQTGDVQATPSAAQATTSIPSFVIATATVPNWTAGVAGYLQTFTAVGGTGSVTFTQSAGTLPAGLTLSDSGVFSGTPTVAGTYIFTVTANDAAGDPSPSQSYTVIINPSPAIATASLPAWTLNQPGYDQAIVATGGTGTLTFTLTAGTLPGGLTLSSGGILSGTPSGTGSFTFTIKVSDTLGASASQSYTVAINPPVAVTTPTAITPTTLASFNGTNGAYPYGTPLLDSSGNLFLTTSSGGASMVGKVDEVTKGGSVVRLGVFNGSNGSEPQAGVIEDSSGNLFGTATYGGAYGYGTVFEIVQGSGTITALASFDSTNGSQPYGGLVEDTSGNLFGTTFGGGPTADYGTVFEVKKGSGAITTLAAFNGSNGANPEASLIEDASGDLFGTTSGGGTSNDGTVFEIASNTGTITTLANFDSTTGQLPECSLVEDNSGNFFGTTTLGGGLNDGTIFELSSTSHTLTILASFDGPQGAIPQTGLVEDGRGDLFGTTVSGGAYGFGTVFELAQGSHSITPIIAFNGTNGTNPYGGVALDSNGNLFGTTEGGSINYGTVFEVPALTAGTGFTQTISATGGTGTLTFTAPVASLPPGLTLSPNGILSGTPTTAGIYNFIVTATDTVGANAGHGYSITVQPGQFSQYTVSVPNPAQAGKSFLVVVQAADPFGNAVNGYSGPASVTVSISPGGSSTTVALSSSGLGLLLAKEQQVGSYTISAASGTFSGSTVVTLTAGPPVRLAFVAQPVNTPTGAPLPMVTVQLLDQNNNAVTSDNSDTVTLAVASGPGFFAAGSTTTATVVNGMATFSNLTLTNPGQYRLEAFVAGRLTGPYSSVFTIAPLQVVPGSFIGTPSGFSLQFDTAILVNSVTPVLYGQGFGATAPVPSVTLTRIKDGMGNPIAPTAVEGSLVLNTPLNQLTFLATNTALATNNGSPVLPDGTYVAVLHSSAAGDGFQTLNSGGGFLDGLVTGVAGSGDYTTTFTVTVGAAGGDVLWVPATADGPGQALNAPGNNQVGGGYPLYLNDTTGRVTNAQLTLNYDPTLLNVTGVSGAGFMMLASSTPGHAVLQYNGAALPMGTQTTVGTLIANVPGGSVANPTPYKAKDLLHLSGASLNGGTIAIATSDALHLVAYVGDADGNGSYGSHDAVLITRTALQSDSGFAVYPLVDPVIVADTDGSGFIPADAALQVNEAGVAFPTTTLPSPPIPAGVVFQPIANNVDPTLMLPATLTVSAQGVVTVPVLLDEADPAGSTGLLRGHLALTYNPSQFTVSAADVHPGSLLAGGGWSIVSTIDQTTGQIGIALSSNTPVTSMAGGPLVTIDFHLTGSFSGSAAFKLVASANPNGELVTTELEDAQGTFTLMPAPSNNFDSRIDGLVQLTSTPVPPTESRVITETVSVEREGVASRSFEAHVGMDGVPESSDPVDAALANSAAILPESLDRPFELSSTAMAAAMHANAATQVAVLSSSSPAFANVITPITSLLFQYGGVILVNLQAPAGQFVPYQSVVSTVTNAIDRLLAGQPPLSQSPVTDLDSLNWNEVGHDLDDSRALADLVALGGRRRCRELTCHHGTPPATVVSEHAAMDQWFAQAADGNDQIMVDE
jgi:uncharacterized repeat protein (TIGR03803 family)